MLMLLLLFIDYDDGGGEKWVCWQKMALTNTNLNINHAKASDC